MSTTFAKHSVLSKEELWKKVHGCWVGKAVGGTLGMVYEGVECTLDLTYYDPVPEEMLPNDDVDLQVVWACVLRDMEEPRVDRQVLLKGWLENIQNIADEYGVAKRNLALGLHPPQTGQYDNWFVDGMGAAIRAEIWACLAAGDPDLAAAYAYEDSCVDHDGDGIWAEIFIARLQAAAFVESDQNKLLDTALMTLPVDSRVRRAVNDTRLWWKETQDWQEVRTRLMDRWGSANMTDVPQNMAIIVLGWLAGGNDYGKALCTAVNCGMDADCTGATLGGLLGILNPEGFSEKWLEPIGNELVLSPTIHNLNNPPKTLDAFTDLVMDLREKLDGKYPKAEEIPPQDTSHLAIRAEIAFDEPFLSKRLHQPEIPYWEMPEDRKEVWFPGHIVWLPYEKFAGNTMLIRYKIHLKEAGSRRIMFNSPESCAAWVDGKFAFCREEGGTMRPTFNYGRANQWAIFELEAGKHEILAAINRPSRPREIVWSCGVGLENRGWDAEAFERRGK